MQPERSLIYRNAMESLVVEEVDRQFQQIPLRLAKYLNKEEVIAFALNRLPALYATSEKGWRQQGVRGRRDYQTQIVEAVRQGLIAVQRDPLRIETPLDVPEQMGATAALQKLQDLLQYEELNWDNLVEAVEKALMGAAQGEITWNQRFRTNPGETGGPWNNAQYKH